LLLVYSKNHDFIWPKNKKASDWDNSQSEAFNLGHFDKTSLIGVVAIEVYYYEAIIVNL